MKSIDMKVQISKHNKIEYDIIKQKKSTFVNELGGKFGVISCDRLR